MKTLPVHVMELAVALDDHNREAHSYYFDSQSGEIAFLMEEQRGSDKRWNIISNSVDRFVPIEPMASQKGYEIMEQFIETLPPSRVREKLEWSLEGSKPFRRFRDTVFQDPAIRERWHEFHAEVIKKIALEWLADHGINPVEPTSPIYPSRLDEEAQALASEEDETSYELIDDAETGDLDDHSDEDFDEFNAEDFSESVDFLSEEEEAELTDFVESLPRADLNMAKLHGLFSAFAAGPVIMSPADLLAALMGCAGEQSVNETTESEHILELLSRFYDGIIEAIESESFAPRFQQKGVMVTDPGGGVTSWCNGFMLGVEHHKAFWQRWFSDMRRVKAISLITGMADPEILSQAEKAIGEETVGATCDTLSDLVPLIHNYWAFESALDDYLGSETDTPEFKVGRNDPCPCGSGKKFKHCHGRFESPWGRSA
jgi:yecA family protein